MSGSRGPRLLLVGAAWMAALGPAAMAGGGNPDAGRALFSGKQCVRCHAPRGEAGAGPPVEILRRPQGEMELTGRLWNHVPGMFATLLQQGLEWPRITAAEMADLMAYLQADPARDPAPDPYRGQVTLVRKGCLKCHSLRREGGRVQPDLADPRDDYESGAAWAAAMWNHTPRMAGTAGREGVPYPRFSGDEMGHLVGFLRSAVAASPRAPRAAPPR